MRVPGASVPALLLVALASCSSTGQVTPEATETTTESTNVSGEQAADSLEPASSSGLGERPGPRRETTGDVPHIQIDAAPVASLDSELRRRVFLLPGVEERESARSLPGAAGIWVNDTVELSRGEILGGGREIAHIHPDGSLHVFLPVELAAEVERTKWGEFHPWADREGFWDGLAMVYTPETMEEVDVAFGLVVASYNFVVGAEIDPSAVG